MTEPVGSLAEEAAKLLTAAQEWARARFEGDHPSDCQFCPVCQAIGALRQVKPETVEHLVAAAASLASALRTTVSPTAPSEPDRVQHIDVDEG
ncbi:MAG: hypothetical protein JWM40_2575 [Frankiales bacterium]|nr:hypothetical protein [Frankiales bacterium]